MRHLGAAGLALVLISQRSLPQSRTRFTLLFCEAERKIANARSWVQWSQAMIMPRA